MKLPRIPAMPRPWPQSAHYPALALLLLLVGVGSVMALHVLSTEVSPASHYISEYGNRTWGWLLKVALILIAIGLLVLGTALREGFRARTALGLRVGPRLLQASGVMLVIAAFFSTDRLGGEVEAATLSGKLHGLMAIGAFCALVAAMIVLSPRLRGEGEELGHPSALALPLALLAPAIAAAAYALLPEADGLRQRAFLAIVFGWLLATAYQVHSLRRASRRSGRAGSA